MTVKKILALIFISLLVFSLFAEDHRHLSLSATVPEDFGIAFPPGVIKLDRFVFEFGFEADETRLLDEWMLPIGEIEAATGSRNLSLLYYGNSSSVYDVTLNFSISDMTLKDSDNGISIPLGMEFSTNPYVDDDIEVYAEQDVDSIRVIIPPAGERIGVPVVDMRFYWDISDGIMPGDYEAELRIELLENN